MIWRVAIATLLTAALSLFAIHAPRAQFICATAGFCSPTSTGGGGAFTGIADVYTNTIAHFGNRAASSARRGNKLLNVCDAATGLVCADWSSDATTGLIVPTTIGGSSCGSIACEVAIAFDDSGLTSCGPGGPSAPCDVTAAHGTRPTLVLSGINGLPTIVCNGTTQALDSGGNNLAISTPFSESIVAKRSSGSAVGAALSIEGTGLAGFDSTLTVMFGYAGTVLDTSSGLTEGVFHALQFAANGGSSFIQGDGQSPVTGNAGTTGANSSVVICNDTFNSFLNGAVAEAWIGTGDQHATFGAAHTNQSTAYGTP